MTREIVGFDVRVDGGDRIGSLATWALPNHGDHVRVYSADDPDSVLYEVVRCEFVPENIVVVVRPAP